MRLNPAYPLLALVLGAIVYCLSTSGERIRAAFADLPAHITGAFPLNGQYRGDSLPGTTGVRCWGSWAGNDDNHGTLALGPFKATRVIHLAIGGYPTRPGNEIHLALQGTKEQVPVKFKADIGERWQFVDIDVPAAWAGQPMSLVASDQSEGPGGWLSISEPLRGGLGTDNTALFRSLTAWMLDLLVLGTLWFAAWRWIYVRNLVAPHWQPLVAAALVATAAYAGFWIFFIHVIAGKAFAYALFVAATAYATRPEPAEPAGPAGPAPALSSSHGLRTGVSSSPGAPSARTPSSCPEPLALARFVVALSFFYVALLHLYPSSRDIFDLAANRYRVELPGDNAVSHDLLAKPMYRHEQVRGGVDWLSSDRPPLQAGWQLLVLPMADTLELDFRVADCLAATWFQLLWVFAAYGLLRTLGLTRAKAFLWVALLATSGFFVLNTAFTWPKLAAASFVCGAFALWFLTDPGETAADVGSPAMRSRTAVVALGAVLAALGWLSHGGAAFSLLAVVPFVLPRVLRGEIRAWLLGALVFAAFAVPWICYQKFYDPPGDRLLKWHLAGHLDRDPRGTLAVAAEEYHRLGWHGAIANKASNFVVLVRSRWNLLFDFSRARAHDRRTDEFFGTTRALTWWVFGFVALAVALARRSSRAGVLAVPRAHLLLAGWAILTLVVWCVLMFLPESTVVHQGSYAAMIALFVAASCWFDFLSPWSIIIVGALQLATFATTWMLSNSAVHGPPNGAGYVGLATLLLLFLLAVELRRGRRLPALEPSRKRVPVESLP